MFIISGDFGGSYPSLNAEGIGVYSLFILFIIGFSLSWSYKIITGVIFFIWNVGMWIVELFLVERAGGFGIISGVPLLILGVLYIVDDYKTPKDPPQTKIQLWRLVLRILVTVYTILYLIFILSGFKPDHKPDLFSWPGVILIVMFAIYGIGFILSWKWEIPAGILFIIWYACLLIPALEPIAYWMGPLKLFGIPVLIQGLLYVFYLPNFPTKQ